MSSKNERGIQKRRERREALESSFVLRELYHREQELLKELAEIRLARSKFIAATKGVRIQDRPPLKLLPGSAQLLIKCGSCGCPTRNSVPDCDFCLRPLQAATQ